MSSPPQPPSSSSSSAPPPPSAAASAAAAGGGGGGGGDAPPPPPPPPPPLSETVLPSGTIVAVLRAGDGVHFAPMGARVRVHYTAQISADGVLSQPFDDSRARGEPLVCRVGTGQLVAGLDDALPLMSKGQLARITVPRVRARAPPRASVLVRRRACSCACLYACNERVHGDASKLTSPLLPPRRPMRGYGGRGYPPIVPPDAVIVYVVEVLAIEIY